MFNKLKSTLLILYVGPIFGFKGASTSQVIGARNEMMMDDYDGQMIFGDPVGLKLPEIRLTVEEKPRKNLTQETCPDRRRTRARCVTSAHATTTFNFPTLFLAVRNVTIQRFVVSSGVQN